jgi:23S rRNA (pseudouridine1915-N3)-methyltransferase
MQKVTILCVGKLKEKFYTEASAEYLKRLQRHCKCEIVELAEYRLPDDPSPAEIQKALATEAAAIREKLPKGGAVVAMCIEGKTCSSEELSRRMADFAVAGKTQVTFLIGGSVGLDASLKQQADWRLSMSPMTFPHHMARVMLLEQIYRAYQIQQGTRYHK